MLQASTDAGDFARSLCSAKAPLRQQYNYTCGATYATLIKGVAGKRTAPVYPVMRAASGGDSQSPQTHARIV